MSDIKKMPLASMDVAAERIEKLKAIFPEAFVEGKVDHDALLRSLGQWVEPGKERFGLNWPGKADCMKVIQTPSVGTLLPMRDESVNFDTTENLIIEGDNLEVLKLLQKSYFGKVKMIYIDPPYNTGNEFIYPDNYREGLEEYLKYSGQVDADGYKFSTNTESEGRFHSRWLSMMYPRLFLARNLMRDDGVIFISIDDNEVHNLRALMNEVFGKENFIATFIWEKRTNRENRKVVSIRHDYVICYCKNRFPGVRTLKQQPMSEKALSNYKNPDNDPRGLWKSDPATAQAGHGTKSQFYVLDAPNGKQHNLESGRCWLYTKEVMQEAIDEGRIWFGKDGNGVPRIKTYLDAKERGLTPESIWFAEDVSTTENSKNQLKELFDGVSVFETPKPVDLLKLAIQISSDDGIILDFFSGSSTAAQAVLELNMEEKSFRRFIMVQLPEPCAEDSEAFKAGYKTIADIGKVRIRKVINKLNDEKSGKLDFDSTTVQDLGFKVLKLSSSNFKVWEGDSDKVTDINKTLSLFAENIISGRSSEDILYELLLKAGFPMTAAVEKLSLAGKEVYSIADGALLICLDKELTLVVVEAMVERQPSQILCLDEGFKGNDQLKVNAVQTVKSRNRNEESDIVFRVV